MKIQELFTPLYEVGIFKGWAGAWIKEDGELVLVNQERDYHHAHAALEEFGEYIEAAESDMDEDYKAVMAMELAFQQGWIAYRYIKPDTELDATWHVEPTREALGSLAAIIRELPDFKSYTFSTPDGMKDFIIKREAFRYIRSQV